jgi:hypothetical protein
VLHARIAEISKGHHYCFIKHKELVFDEMRKKFAAVVFVFYEVKVRRTLGQV